MGEPDRGVTITICYDGAVLLPRHLVTHLCASELWEQARRDPRMSIEIVEDAPSPPTT